MINVITVVTDFIIIVILLILTVVGKSKICKHLTKLVRSRVV